MAELPPGERLLAELNRGVEMRFREMEEIPPVFIGEIEGANPLLIFTNWANDAEKFKILHGLRQLFAEKGVCRYGFVVEGWTAPKDGGPRARDREDRGEAVVFMVVEPGRHTLAAQRAIIRPWGGDKPTLGPIERKDFDDGEESDGPILELLKPLKGSDDAPARP